VGKTVDSPIWQNSKMTLWNWQLENWTMTIMEFDILELANRKGEFGKNIKIGK
jgi:hypothetical protein